MKYTLLFRLWHWLNALVVLGLLGTVFLRKTFLNYRTNSEILTSKLGDMGVEITKDQSITLAKAIRAGMWEWHIILGYALAVLVIFRIYLYFKDVSLRDEFNSLSLHKKTVKALYYLFYSSIIFMTLSGFAMHFHQELCLTKEMAYEIKEMHELIFNLILIFVPLHIAGVIIADNRNEKGITSTMINGKK